MTDKTAHPSDSSKQREIEQLIVSEISKKENLKFETLNMIKPIKLKQRKTFDTHEQEKIVNFSNNLIKSTLKPNKYQ